MRQSHSGVGLVDMLPASSSSTVGIHPQIFWPDIDLNSVVKFWIHEHGRERSMAASISIKRRNAHKAMNPSFCFDVAIGVRAFDCESSAFDAPPFAGLVIRHCGFIAFTF